MVTLETVSVAETGALLPPVPLQINEYVVVALTAPVVRVPLLPSVPLQPPDAAHEAALFELQVNVDEPPGAITEGYTESVAEGTIVTVAVAGELVPPGPEQTRVYVVGAFTAPVAWVPLAGSEPVQPPDAVQDVALVEFQVSVDEPPGATLAGEALRLAVGAAGGGKGLTVIEAVAGGLVPPGPEHVNENVEFAVSAPVLRDPLAASAPLQPPAAVHAVA